MWRLFVGTGRSPKLMGGTESLAKATRGSSYCIIQGSA